MCTVIEQIGLAFISINSATVVRILSIPEGLILVNTNVLMPLSLQLKR
jgi:hypothetical protein